jgi:hypothetical protein
MNVLQERMPDDDLGEFLWASLPPNSNLDAIRERIIRRRE